MIASSPTLALVPGTHPVPGTGANAGTPGPIQLALFQREGGGAW